MRVIDADKLKKDNPGRRSLGVTVDKAPTVTIADKIEDIKADICDNYCKMPYKYSAAEWEEIVLTDDGPCNNCPLNRL